MVPVIVDTKLHAVDRNHNNIKDVSILYRVFSYGVYFFSIPNSNYLEFLPVTGWYLRGDMGGGGGVTLNPLPVSGVSVVVISD